MKPDCYNYVVTAVADIHDCEHHISFNIPGKIKRMYIHSGINTVDDLKVVRRRPHFIPEGMDHIDINLLPPYNDQYTMEERHEISKKEGEEEFKEMAKHKPYSDCCTCGLSITNNNRKNSINLILDKNCPKHGKYWKE